LKSIFHESSGNDALLAAWLVNDGRDVEIGNKDATRELTKLIKARLSLDLPIVGTLSKLRAVTLRYVLAGEFTLHLSCAPPASLDGVPKPATKDKEAAVRELARRLRTSYPDAYTALADRVEEELGLKAAKIPPDAIDAIDTFRFEERALLRHAGELIADKKFGDALELVGNARRASGLIETSEGRPSGKLLGVWPSSATWPSWSEQQSPRCRAT
jgi:hypothetical protein